MKSSFFYYQKKKQKAFSLAEVLLAAFTLSVGLTATAALVASSIEKTYGNRDAAIGVELAQEGIELVRNVRDQNFAQEKEGIPSGQGFSGFSETDKHCRMNSSDNLFTCYPSQGTPASRSYFLDEPASPGAGGRYQHTSATRRFGRYIYIDYNDAAKNARVVSYVFWGWTNDNAMPSFIPNNGGTTSCTLENKCVFSEVFFSRWVR